MTLTIILGVVIVALLVVVWLLAYELQEFVGRYDEVVRKLDEDALEADVVARYDALRSE